MINHLKQKSTQAGIIGLSASFGLIIPEPIVSGISAVIIAGVSLYEIIRKELA